MPPPSYLSFGLPILPDSNRDAYASAGSPALNLVLDESRFGPLLRDELPTRRLTNFGIKNPLTSLRVSRRAGPEGQFAIDANGFFLGNGLHFPLCTEIRREDDAVILALRFSELDTKLPAFGFELELASERPGTHFEFKLAREGLAGPGRAFLRFLGKVFRLRLGPPGAQVLYESEASPWLPLALGRDDPAGLTLHFKPTARQPLHLLEPKPALWLDQHLLRATFVEFEGAARLSDLRAVPQESELILCANAFGVSGQKSLALRTSEHLLLVFFEDRSVGLSANNEVRLTPATPGAIHGVALQTRVDVRGQLTLSSLQYRGQPQGLPAVKPTLVAASSWPALAAQASVRVALPGTQYRAAAVETFTSQPKGGQAQHPVVLPLVPLGLPAPHQSGHVLKTIEHQLKSDRDLALARYQALLDRAQLRSADSTEVVHETAVKVTAKAAALAQLFDGLPGRGEHGLEVAIGREVKAGLAAKLKADGVKLGKATTALQAAAELAKAQAESYSTQAEALQQKLKDNLRTLVPNLPRPQFEAWQAKANALRDAGNAALAKLEKDQQAAAQKARERATDAVKKVREDLLRGLGDVPPLDLDLGGFQVKDLPRLGDPREFVPLLHDFKLEGVKNLALERLGRMVFEPAMQQLGVTGLVKLGRTRTASELLEEMGVSVELPDFLARADWAGTLLLRQRIRFTEEVLHALCPEGLEAEYVALTPSRSDGTFAVSARITYRNARPRPEKSGGGEWAVRVQELDAEIRNSELVFFRAEVHFTIGSFLGVTGAPTQVRLIGSLDGQTGAFRFQWSDGPLPLLPEGGVPFIRQANISSIAIVGRNGGGCSVLLDGEFTFASEATIEAPKLPVAFTNLAIEIARLQPEGAWLQLGYPSLRFPLDVPPAVLPPFELTFLGVEVSPDGKLAERGLEVVKAPSGLQIGLVTRLDLTSLPELAGVSAGRLSFELALIATPGAPGLGVSLRAGGADELSLDLFRFLQVRFKHVKFDTGVLGLIGGSVAVLDTPIVKEAGAVLFQRPNGANGFLAWMMPGDVARNGLFQLDWGIIGKNVTLPAELAKKLLEIIPASNATQDKLGLSIEDALGLRGASFKSIVDKLKDQANDANERWLIAAGFKALGTVLEGRVLFEDRHYYGIAIHAPILKEALGLDLPIGVLFIKGREAAFDRFSVSVTVPRVQLGALNFSGGVVRVELAMNGDFLFDLGYPWPDPNGGRQWERSLGAIVGIFQGSGGVYFRKDTLATRHQSVTSLSAGVMVQFGLGIGANGAVFKVWATLGIYAIAEGTIQLQAERGLTALRMTAAVGLVGRASAELDLWIITARVEVLISVEARATLTWGRFLEGDAPAAFELPAQSTRLDVAFEPLVRASASACIGRGFFKICVSVHIEVKLTVSATVYL